MIHKRAMAYLVKLQKEATVTIRYSTGMILVILMLFLCSCTPSIYHPKELETDSGMLQQTPADTDMSEPNLDMPDSTILDACAADSSRPPVQAQTFSGKTFEIREKGDLTPANKIKIRETLQSTLDDALEFCQVAQDFWQKGDLEKALDSLDQAYSLILNVDTHDDPQLIQQKEDLRFMISKRIMEIYASRNIVVSGNHNAIPVEINSHVQKEITLFTGKEKNFFIESYKRSGRYRGKILRSLKEAGLPEELSWLPLIESGFKVTALSPARALGLWQFIPSTGYKFGLKRDLYTDERLHPEKSTQAAIAYLKELHAIFGDWATVLAAYNCGEGKVLQVIRHQNVNYLDNFWDLYQRLPYETARYVPRFLATIHIIDNLEEFGLDGISVYEPYTYETVIVERQAHLKDIASRIGTTQKELRELNPELRHNILPKGKYFLNVPPGKGNVLLAEIDQVPLSSPPTGSMVYHRIRPGETLSTIARRYRTSVRSIALANNITQHHRIVAGKRLKIPQKGTQIYPVTAQGKPPESRTVTTHVVSSGDSLWILAKKYGTTVKEIQEINQLKNTNLSIKQVLKIPSEPRKYSVRKGSKTYQVQRGDSPYKIATKYNISLNHLLQINNLTSRCTIYPGQTLLVE